MSKYDFSVIYSHHPKIIKKMPSEFGSHQFILKLAQEYQSDYIEALFAYRNSTRKGISTPFMVVHGLLAKGLRLYPELVEYLGKRSSVDIFGQSNGCSFWRRL